MGELCFHLTIVYPVVSEELLKGALRNVAIDQVPLCFHNASSFHIDHNIHPPINHLHKHVQAYTSTQTSATNQGSIRVFRHVELHQEKAELVKPSMSANQRRGTYASLQVLYLPILKTLMFFTSAGTSSDPKDSSIAECVMYLFLWSSPPARCIGTISSRADCG